MNISFFVPGLPRPGGSKRAFVLRRRDGTIVTRPGGSPVVNITEDAKCNKEWRNAVGWYARKEMTGTPTAGPIELIVQFVLPRPKGHFGSGRNAGMVKASSPAYPTGKPDCTKLLRSTEDALKNILWLDDSQVVKQVVTKVYGDTPGAMILVREIT